MSTKKRSKRTILSEEVNSIDTSADVNIRNSNKRPRSEILDGREYERTRPLLKRRESIVNSSRGRNEVILKCLCVNQGMSNSILNYCFILFTKDTEILDTFVDNRGECYQYTI